MIVGIGTDIVSCERIAGVYRRHGERFINKILADSEKVDLARAASVTAFLAKRFAAKEAAAKALGVGIGAKAGLHDIAVVKDAQGAPRLQFSGVAAETARSRGVAANHISLSDENDYAVAFVVLEG